MPEIIKAERCLFFSADTTMLFPLSHQLVSNGTAK